MARRLTTSKERYALNVFPGYRVGDLSGDDLERTCCDQIDRRAEGNGVKEEFIHDHVHDHHNSE